MNELAGPGDDPISVSRDGAIATVLLDRPQRANAMDARFFESMSAALRGIATDESIRAVVLAGEGKHFCAGGDLRHPLFDEPDADARRPQIQAAYDVTEQLLDLDVPVVCAIQGRVAGAATALVLASDIRIAAPSTVFSLDFVRLGLSPDMGVCWLLTPAIGTSRALEMALSGDFVDAETAHAWGLVSKVVDEGGQREVAIETAQRLAQHPRAGMAAIRRLVRNAHTMPRAEGFAAEIRSMNSLIATADAQGRLAVFRSRATRGAS
ncbi:MAG: enoyl-CoA hydratase/isomerase family protein [Ilumatobacteraceae bacterium]